MKSLACRNFTYFLFSRLVWELLWCAPLRSFCSHYWQFRDPPPWRHTGTWTLIGRGQIWSVTSLLTKTQHKFIALWLPNLPRWLLQKTEILWNPIPALKSRYFSLHSWLAVSKPSNNIELVEKPSSATNTTLLLLCKSHCCVAVVALWQPLSTDGWLTATPRLFYNISYYISIRWLVL